MKKVLSILLAIIIVIAMPLSAAAKTMLIGDVNGDGKVTAADARLVLRVAAGLEPSLGTVNVDDVPGSTDNLSYRIGETWRVAGQWELTIDSVEKNNYRYEDADEHPVAAYIVHYTYKNLGYVDKDEIWDGLYIDISDSIIVDAGGKTCYSYGYGVDGNYPDETPVGAYCEAVAGIGVDHSGNFTLYFDKYDGNEKEQKATFYVEVN